MRAEEQLLGSQFDDEYEAYRARTSTDSGTLLRDDRPVGPRGPA